MDFVLFLTCFCVKSSKSYAENLKIFSFFTVKFESKSSLFLWCRSAVGKATQTHTHTHCKNKGNNNNVSCVKDV